jgi:hypothetical protein
MHRASLLVALMLLAAPPLAAQEWSAEEQEVVEWLDAFAEEAYTGGADTFLAWIHPEITSWDYSTKTPLDWEPFTETVAELFASNASVELVIKPLSVQVFGDLAIVHAWYKETITGPDGDAVFTGRWTAVLKKGGDGWRHLAWAWLQKEWKPEKEKKKEEG